MVDATRAATERRLAELRARVTETPGDEEAWLVLGQLLVTDGARDEALDVYRRGLEALPDSGDLRYACGRALEDAGDREQARACYEEVVRRFPEAARPLASLLGLLRGAADDAQVAAGDALLGSPSLGDEDRAALGYALGKVRDAHGEYDHAMSCWQTANAARRRMRGGLDLRAFRALADDLRRDFTAASFDPPDGTANDGSDLVFVVGMPRSGTTLVEQILAANPQVHGCGELTVIPAIVAGLPAQGRTSALPEASREALRKQYLEASRRGAPGSAARRVDKQPLNFLYLGQVALLFPAARIVWCRRDARDVAISIYGEEFSPESTYATDLGEILGFAAIQEQLMGHWKLVVPNPVHEVVYEDLVRDPEACTRALVDFAGLAWDPACLEFHGLARSVDTPSRWQVRQPVHARSVGRWKNYEKWFPDAPAPGAAGTVG